MMKTRAAALLQQPGHWQVIDVDLAPPQVGEVLVRFKVAGLCHSDEHAATGDLPVGRTPFIGGHEGSGVIEAVGPGVTRFEVGDRVATKFVPSCGFCASCYAGRMTMCDLGMFALAGCMPDGSYRASYMGEDVAQMTMIGTFAQHAVASEYSLVKIPEGVSYEAAAMVSCGVASGWGSVENGAGVALGDTVIVMGVGGVGINAVQAAAVRGAAHVIAVDPVEFKREQALLFGATHTFAEMGEAADFARLVTDGRGADAAIVCVGVTTGEHVAQAFSAIGARSTVVVTGIGDSGAVGLPVNLWELAMTEKRIQGVLFGMGNPGADVPRLLDMYRSGRLKLDELITRRYTLDEIDAGYRDMHDGKNIRGVIVHEE
ncbi:S-(hydroxymethyl)glutathione dehydrogenase/alcohol dehydrogenase [Nocardiopsis mwathae]|uniref:S-(Hydroxymethyl)glutathione dehydrogenase/alcohol dehydrogenase n=1 Tax=Nocardiopsis mwathae TaxID=1472723 RepID=A0A7W9YG05_9ACTN|nr:NDMA-dependent alcohol dehydrogenase [Nocardiopsis mwathae]MBB6170591.1 S-(hydroxymethyl)glutathione dehydrogenase/alcohol dehydrogenase [Nocardiopsis mwathae]